MTFTPDFARGLGFAAHHGQTEKDGGPYRNHLDRVASMLPRCYRAGAYCHDMVEDTKFTLELLRELGADEGMLTAVAIVTKPPKAERPAGWTYIGWAGHGVVGSGSIQANRIKLADVDDHLREGYEEVLTEEKIFDYVQTQEILRQYQRDRRRDFAADLIARTVYGERGEENIARAAHCVKTDPGYLDQLFNAAIIREPRDRDELLAARGTLTRKRP